ncbi:T9SS type A sorting domain-containing protein [Adhaeribacter swui]|uniref:T9SS type A sorting domain-containing protein n=1 Tax=Adhaeribacter swui TaxID=2086471 RepID=A0A7G7G5C2_9BACT|nr:PA14 domain-containing protein [Adhaeribacter swui]QNF32356.1 T9SS type A sorting domain-containing protein [Adhaeribacter swui]
MKVSFFAFLLVLVSFLSFAQQEERIRFTSIAASEDTGLDYSPWLDDNLQHLVQSSWLPANLKYVDVTLKLEVRSKIKKLSFYDHEGVFTAKPAEVYALNGKQKVFLGLFTGEAYLSFVDLLLKEPTWADAIIIRKYSNNIPQKIKIFGLPASKIPSVIRFPALASKRVGDAPFDLVATSNNPRTPVLFTSTNPGVVAVSNVGGTWKATVLAPGVAKITASQAASTNYTAAQNVTREQVVQPVVTSLQGKIPIDPRRWYQLNNTSNSLVELFDGKTNKRVETGWGKILSSYDSYYPVLNGEQITIESIKFYDGEGTNKDNPMTLSVITNDWKRLPIATFLGEKYNTWVGPDPNKPADFKLKAPIKNIKYLVITTSWAYPTEIEIYGTYKTTAGAITPITLAPKKEVKLKDAFGVNAFEWDFLEPNNPEKIDETRMKLVKGFSGIRHYLDWERLESKEGSYTYNPSHSGGWNYDAIYERCKAEKIEVLACLKTLPRWMMATYPEQDRDDENVPVKYGKNFSDPKSYLEQAKVAFQFAARYGSNKKVNPALLSVDKKQRWTGDGINTVKIGLDLIKYIECDNERDKWWKGRKAYQTAREYAANLSAFYDGHKNTMGPGVGVKNADPNMQVVMAGLALPSIDYVKGMIDWCKEFRGYNPDGSVNLCWDVLNYHLYATDTKTSQGGNPTRGAAPEVSEASKVAADFVQMAHEYARDMPVWITELGYDFNQASPLKAVKVGNKSVLATQADWILRSSLLYARSGVDKTFFFILYDPTDPANPMQFSSMGLVNNNKTRRPAADYIYQVKKQFGEYMYKETLLNDPIVDRYELNGQSAYALVVPDEIGRTTDYFLDIGKSPFAYLYRPKIGQDAMEKQKVYPKNGKVEIAVTETPVFVVPEPINNCTATGTILREQWNKIPGKLIAAIPAQNKPTSSVQLKEFESQSNSQDNYGARIRGYICPPVSGNYTFRIAGDDSGELWLSTDDNPANKKKIAEFKSYTTFRQWDKFASQKSKPINLVAGQRYYVEAWHKEAAGKDHISVSWQLPNGVVETPIPGTRLSPFLPSGVISNNSQIVDYGSDNFQPAEQPTLLIAYPNPFKKQLNIQYNPEESGETNLGLYNAQGKLVRQLFTGKTEAGVIKHLTLNAEGMAPGIYIVLLNTGAKVLTQKVILNK